MFTKTLPCPYLVSAWWCILSVSTSPIPPHAPSGAYCCLCVLFDSFISPRPIPSSVPLPLLPTPRCVCSAVSALQLPLYGSVVVFICVYSAERIKYTWLPLYDVEYLHRGLVRLSSDSQMNSGCLVSCKSFNITYVHLYWQLVYVLFTCVDCLNVSLR